MVMFTLSKANIKSKKSVYDTGNNRQGFTLGTFARSQNLKSSFSIDFRKCFRNSTAT